MKKRIRPRRTNPNAAILAHLGSGSRQPIAGSAQLRWSGNSGEGVAD
jgi:hypothetical protein